MYKVLLVDDEMLVKLGIRSILDWSDEGFEIAGEASGGKEGVQMALALQPDLIISDIAMPEMDGIEMLEEIKKNGLDPVFVALSSYDQFELVKRAMKAGARDYLLKLKINADSLHELLQGIREDLDRKNLQNRLSAGAVSAQEEEELGRLYYYNLMLGEDIAQMPSSYWFHTAGAARVCYIATDSLRLQAQKTEMERKIYGRTIRALITEICREFQDAYCIDWGNGIFVAVIADDGRNRTEELEQMATAIMNSLDNYGNLQSAIGFSAPAQEPAMMKRAFQMARQIREELRYQGYGKIRFYEELSEEQTRMEMEREPADLVDLDHLTHLCETLSGGEFSNYVSGFNYRIRSDHLSLENAAFQSAKMICIMEEHLKVNWRDRAIPTDADIILQRIYRAETVDEIIRCNREYSIQVEMFFDEFGGGDAGRLVRDAKQYIKDHITEPISLKDVAAAMNVSPSYLSTVFSRTEETSLTNYINKKKIQKAQHMLVKERLKIYEVSMMLGFESAGYFAKVFKKYAGCTPSQYLEGRQDPGRDSSSDASE